MQRAIKVTIVTMVAIYLLALSGVSAFAVSKPGDVVIVNASCTFKNGKRDLTVSTKYVLVVRSVISRYQLNPVYLTQACKPTLTATGETVWVLTDKTASGVVVRAFVWNGDRVMLLDGVQASDGSVVAGGKAYVRSFGPSQ